MSYDKSKGSIKEWSQTMFKRFEQVCEPHTHLIEHEFNVVKSGLERLIGNNASFATRLEAMAVSFEKWDFNRGAYFRKEDYTDKQSEEITINLHSGIKSRYKYMCIHEFSHMIAWNYISVYEHTLEFAIISYCLEIKLFGDKGSFFRAYDIAEDRAYSELFINPCKFDEVIRSIRFDTLDELTEKAMLIATKIRLKQAPFSVYQWEKEHVEKINK
jgi:hypothetical protein